MHVDVNQTGSMGAVFNEDRTHRLTLWRIWDKEKPLMMVVGLNPSNATHVHDSPTMTRVTRFVKDWGYGGFYMTNLFTFITPKPRLLDKSIIENVPGYNIPDIAGKCKDVLFGWGAFDIAKNRDEAFKALFPEALCLGKNADGSPRHPLFVKADTKPTPY